MSRRDVVWTNASTKLLSDDDPVAAVLERARALFVRGLDLGWSGPPFDPLRLAGLLGFELVPTADVVDATISIGSRKRPTIRYNPLRPKGRVRYSIAHEIAHTLFPDWDELDRFRQGRRGKSGDSWQLESLCNLAAAELLMPQEHCEELLDAELDTTVLATARKRFEVSMETVLLRTVRARGEPCAAFCASVRENEGSKRYRMDYVVGNADWRGGIRVGERVPVKSVIAECSAIGSVAEGVEKWGAFPPLLRLDCFGMPPYPGALIPRVCGLLRLDDPPEDSTTTQIETAVGDATLPRGEGPRVIVQIVNDRARVWGGGGFASAMRRRYPDVQKGFIDWARSSPDNQTLGRTHFQSAGEDVVVASMVAQHGFGESSSPRIRYEALRVCLRELSVYARATGASIHMPMIGTGLAGGRWDVILQLLEEAFVRSSVPVTVYRHSSL